MVGALFNVISPGGKSLKFLQSTRQILVGKYLLFHVGYFVRSDCGIGFELIVEELSSQKALFKELAQPAGQIQFDG